MKAFAVILAAQAAGAPAFAGDGLDAEACTFNALPLFGDVQVVESFPDLKVKIVESFADIKVKVVDSFPEHCGEWRFVESFPDLKIQYVESFPDITIEMTTSFPGML